MQRFDCLDHGRDQVEHQAARHFDRQPELGEVGGVDRLQDRAGVGLVAGLDRVDQPDLVCERIVVGGAGGDDIREADGIGAALDQPVGERGARLAQQGRNIGQRVRFAHPDRRRDPEVFLQVLLQVRERCSDQCKIRLGGAQQQARSSGKVGHRDELRVRGLAIAVQESFQRPARHAGSLVDLQQREIQGVEGERESEAPQPCRDAGRRLHLVPQQPAQVALQQQRPRPGEFRAQPAVLLQRALHRSGNERELVRLQRQGAVGVRFHQRDEILDRPVADRGQPVDEQSGDDHAPDQRQDRVPVKAGEALRVETAGHQRDVVPVDDVGAQRVGGVSCAAQRDPVEDTRIEHARADSLELREVDGVVGRGDDAEVGVEDDLHRVGRPGGVGKDALEQIARDVDHQPAVRGAGALQRRPRRDHLDGIVHVRGEIHALRGAKARPGDIGERPEPCVVAGIQQRPLSHLVVGGGSVAARRDHHVELGEIDVEVGAAGAGGVVGVEVAGDAVRPVDFVVGHRQRLEQHAAERDVVGDDVVELYDVAHDGVEKGLHLLQQQLVGAARFLREDGAGAPEHKRAEDDRYDENEQERKQIGVEQTALMTCPSHTRSDPPECSAAMYHELAAHAGRSGRSLA